MSTINRQNAMSYWNNLTDDAKAELLNKNSNIIIDGDKRNISSLTGSEIELLINKILLLTSFIRPNYIYRIKYAWNGGFRLGVGRYNPDKHDNVDIICDNGGVTYIKLQDVYFLYEIGVIEK